MPRTLPFAYSKLTRETASLHYWDGERNQELIEIELGSEQWFAWLSREQSFRLTYWPKDGQSVNLTVRPEKRGRYTYWQGWKTIRGKTTKKYIAPSARLTKTKLDAIGEWFAEQVKTKNEADPSLVFYAAAVDLAWLVEQLIEHCAQPSIAEQAKEELARIRRSFGN